MSAPLEGPADFGADAPLFEAFVGPRWDAHYRQAFLRIRAGSGSRLWNWEAALVPLWLDYRKVPGWFPVCALMTIAAIVANIALTPPLGAAATPAAFALVYLLAGLVEGAVGDRLLHWHARRAIGRVKTSGADAAAQLSAVSRFAPRRGGGVALQVVAWALFVAVGLFLFMPSADWNGANRNSMRKAETSGMKSLLRDLATAQETYLSNHGTYSASLGALRIDVPAPLTLSAETFDANGTPVASGSRGWSAVLVQPDGRRCGIFVESAPPVHAGAKENEPYCW